MELNISGCTVDYEDVDDYSEAVADAAIGFTAQRRQLRRELRALWRQCIGADAHGTSARAGAAVARRGVPAA